MPRDTRTPHVLGEPTLQGLAMYIKEHDIRKILVLLGAGVSVGAGIPDFRSPHTGIYANLGKYNLDTPTDAFSLPLLRENPEIFYTIAREMNLWPGNFKPTAVHYFVKLLSDEGRLLRCCTQNIDGLERAAGVPVDLLVEAHGSFNSASCIACQLPYDINKNKEEAMDGVVSHCHSCGGVVKPDVVFFGEALPEQFFNVLLHDTHEAEMVIIIGTSLQVHPFAALPLRVHSKVPRIVFNMERVGGSMFWFPSDEIEEDEEEDGEKNINAEREVNNVVWGKENKNDKKYNSCNKETTEKQVTSKTQDYSECNLNLLQGNHTKDNIDNNYYNSNNDKMCIDNSSNKCANEKGNEAKFANNDNVNSTHNQHNNNNNHEEKCVNNIEYVEDDVDVGDEEEEEEEESSSDGYAQYGEYYNHPIVCRDLFIAGDCQESVQELAKLMGFGDRLAIAMMRSHE